jgi:hypothetical protein
MLFWRSEIERDETLSAECWLKTVGRNERIRVYLWGFLKLVRNESVLRARRGGQAESAGRRGERERERSRNSAATTVMMSRVENNSEEGDD